MAVKELLIALDFSSCAERVAREGAALAKQLGARVSLVHVVVPTPGVAPQTRLPVYDERSHTARDVTAREYLQSSIEQRLARFAELIDTDPPPRVAVRFGDPAEMIVAEAKESGADMILTGTHGRTGLSRALYGSVAADVVRSADVPVVTIRAQWSSSCEARNCNWCAESGSPEEQRVDAEQYG